MTPERGGRRKPHPIRYAILDHASDEASLWELPWQLIDHIDGRDVERHTPRTVTEVLPHLLDLIREGHVEIFRLADSQGPSLPLAEALAVASDEANWDPSTATDHYGVITTESGNRECETEHNAAQPLE